MVNVCEIKRVMKDAKYLGRNQPICKDRVMAFHNPYAQEVAAKQLPTVW